MSAFVVGTDCMDRVVRAICGKGKYGPFIRNFAGVATDAPNAMTEIGRRLFTLNTEAVQQRYPHHAPDDLAGPCDDDGKSTALQVGAGYTNRSKPREMTRKIWADSFKALQCLQYQCSEGDVMESDLFKELDTAIGVIACNIVEMLPEYEAADWG